MTRSIKSRSRVALAPDAANFFTIELPLHAFQRLHIRFKLFGYSEGSLA
jgi:hypothetical protein